MILRTDRSPSPKAILTVVAFGVFIAADDLTVVSTMLQPIVRDLGITLPDGLDQTAWIVNAYLIAFVAVMPFMGRLSDIVGRRRTFMAALAVFLAGSVLVPLADTFALFLVGRILTAMGGGALIPIGLAVVADVYDETRRARALGVLGGVETLGWVWGPLYGSMLVRFVGWRWQFYINIPLALLGMAAAWWLLRDFDRPKKAARIDWAGAATLTVALVALNVALLGTTDIQSVSGLEELTGASGPDLRWFYPVALLAGAWFIRIQRLSLSPLIDFRLFAGRNATAALTINFLVGAALIVTMVNVPLFINIVELDIKRSAVTAGLVLSALTLAMAIGTYLGGRVTERWWYRPPVAAGLVGATVAFLLMGAGWTVDTAYPVMAWQLATLGLGLGLVAAPTLASVVDAAPPDRRGTAAGLVIVVRVMGLSVGLSGLTAFGLHRYNHLRQGLELPAIVDTGFQESLQVAQTQLTSSVLAESFLACAVLGALAFGVSYLMKRQTSGGTTTTSRAAQQQTPTTGRYG